MDKYRIDSHKLIYHVDRVHAWQQGENVYPIYMEISPAGTCNHRCTFCALDYMEYQKRFLDTAMLTERLSEMGRLGLKSIMYAGEGEPLLHKDMAEIVRATQGAGIDVAMTSNGVLLRPEVAAEIMPHMEWIKISINAGTPETYSRIHRCKAADFDKVVDNLASANELRRSRNLRCTLGMQLLLIPENAQEVRELAVIARDIGMDYLVVKPYSQHPKSHTEVYRQIDYNQYVALADELKGFNTDTFSVLFRTNAMTKAASGKRCYDRCLAIPFWAYLDAGGNVWGCSVHLGDEHFCYGNLYDQTFQQIWEGERRRQSLEWMDTNLDLDSCRINCRMDEVNNYLWQLTHPPEHVNFI